MDVHQSYTVINCIFSDKYEYLSCHVEYGQDCNQLSFEKERSTLNGSDVSLLLFDIVPSMVYCLNVTATNLSYSVEVQGSFRGRTKLIIHL